MATSEITAIVRQYHKMSLWIIFGSVLIGLLIMQAFQKYTLVNALCGAAVFSLFCNVFYGLGWKAVAKNSPANLGKFYLAGATIRMMLALVVIVIMAFTLRPDRMAILGFTAVFAAFYVIMLVYDCVFFARVEKNNNLSKK
jgi:hypothetical protein